MADCYLPTISSAKSSLNIMQTRWKVIAELERNELMILSTAYRVQIMLALFTAKRSDTLIIELMCIRPLY